MKRQVLQGITLMSGVVTAYAFSKASRTANLRGQIVVILAAHAAQGCCSPASSRVRAAKSSSVPAFRKNCITAKAQLREWGVEVFALLCYVSNQTQVNSLLVSIMLRWGRVDILVNNAGTIQVTPIQSATPNDFVQAKPRTNNPSYQA